jgi:hypothetical protein
LQLPRADEFFIYKKYVILEELSCQLLAPDHDENVAQTSCLQMQA